MILWLVENRWTTGKEMRRREMENKRHMPNENAGLRVPEKSDTSIILLFIYSIIINRNLFAFVPLAHPSVHSNFVPTVSTPRSLFSLSSYFPHVSCGV